MPIADHDGLDTLCASCGIVLHYYDIGGQRHEPSIEVKRSLLAALQYPVNGDEDIRHNLEKVESRNWGRMVAAVLVHRQSDVPIRVTLTLTPAQIEEAISWELCEESGQLHQGSWEIDAGEAIGESAINGARLLQFEVILPDITGIGYHQLTVKSDDNAGAQATLIIVPETCYQPPELADGSKIWGISLQLFALRSKRNWGIGDFTDLHSVVEILAPLGINVLGLNPLHALFSQLPENASPYSPSSRDFLNPIYLDIEAIHEFKHSQEAKYFVKNNEFQAGLQALRVLELINYSKVWDVKLQVLETLYKTFKQRHQDADSARIKAFRQFQKSGGRDLFRFALFEALQAFFHRQDADIDRWQEWPEAYRDPESATVKRWAVEHRDEIEFHQYLQWNAEQQLSAIHEKCKRHGMCIGIYRDLAVGNAKSSAQCWAEQADYALDMGIGAPPDDFNSNGQNWGLPPLRPQALVDQAYRPFINTLRANMRYAGALRIDHIMGLMRLFWVPPDCSPETGTYVSYPFTDMLGILALESQRNHCLIIGEDLGTVPDEVRHALETNKILSYRILYFEKDWHHGTIKPPEEYPHYALCTSGSHDLPTMRGFWQGADLELRERLNLYQSGDFIDQQQQIRQQDRLEILAALTREDLITSEETDETTAGKELSSELAVSIQRYLARSQSMLLMVQLEDLLLQSNQVNVPGTINEYPNWRGKLSTTLEYWPNEINLEDFALSINAERNACVTN